MSGKIRVLVAEPGKPCQAREVEDELQTLQALVGGNIEAVTSIEKGIAIVCNREGKLLGLPSNRPLLDPSGQSDDILHGTFFITGVQGESFASLTDEQIGRYKEVYDNVMVLASERTEDQAEIAPEAAMLNFAVACQLTFRSVQEDQLSAESQDAFTAHVNGVFDQDKALSERTVGNLDVTFHGRCAEVRYTFARQDKDGASAEMFSKQCVLDVRDKLEEYGCKIEKIECFAEELGPDHGRDRAGSRGAQDKKRKGDRHER